MISLIKSIVNENIFSREKMKAAFCTQSEIALLVTAQQRSAKLSLKPIRGRRIYFIYNNLTCFSCSYKTG